MAAVEVHYLKELALLAGELIKNNIAERDKKVEAKYSSADLVTETDLAVEKMLRNHISNKFPNHSFLCEESAAANQKLTNSPTWIIDPIDGTTNFCHSAPFVAVSIAFAVDEKVVHGVVYNPITNDMFWGSRGEGSFHNGKRMNVSACTNISKSLIATGHNVAFRRKLEEQKVNSTIDDATLLKLEQVKECSDHNFLNMITKCGDLRALGSAALSLAFVAAGYLDCFAEIGVKEWDIAAGVLLVEEAKGYTCRYDGTPLGNFHDRNIIAAATPELSTSLTQILNVPTFAIAELE